MTLAKKAGAALLAGIAAITIASHSSTYRPHPSSGRYYAEIHPKIFAIDDILFDLQYPGLEGVYNLCIGQMRIIDLRGVDDCLKGKVSDEAVEEMRDLYRNNNEFIAVPRRNSTDKEGLVHESMHMEYQRLPPEEKERVAAVADRFYQEHMRNDKKLAHVQEHMKESTEKVAVLGGDMAMSDYMFRWLYEDYVSKADPESAKLFMRAYWRAHARAEASIK